MQLPTQQPQQRSESTQQQYSTTIPSSNSNNDTMDLHNKNCTATSNSKKKKKHKKKSKSSSNNNITTATSKVVADFAAKTQADMVDAMMNHHVIRHGGDHSHSGSSSTFHSNKNKQQQLKNGNGEGEEKDNFWSSTNNTEERQKIREFWLQLGEDERRSLVKVEKEAVLRKMKEQQKHSCNCSVCGKKR
jgi:hypothetical protein